jgi:hypothetical protein
MAGKKKLVFESQIKLLETQREIAWKLLRERHGDTGEEELSDDFIIWDKQFGIGSHPEDVPVKEWYFKTSAALDSIFGKTDKISRKFKRIEETVTIDDPSFLGYQFSTAVSGALLREGIKILDKAILYKKSHIELVNLEPSSEKKSPIENLVKKTNKYDVALSFAGENREYVAQVAKTLKSLGIRVFYDEDQEIDMWGKDLPIHLEIIYGEKSETVVIFGSKYYAEKSYPRHELKAALSKAIKSKKEYILPAKFDESKIPGIPDSTKFIDLRKYTPEKFAEIIIKKLKHLGIRSIDEEYPHSSQKEPSGLNRIEGVIEVLSMSTYSGKRSVRVQWIGANIPILSCDDISDEEWNIFKVAFKKDKKILIAGDPRLVSFEHLHNFHDVFMKILK